MKFKINEIFQSIQGEGLMIGTSMNFIRFCGCNLSCNWCDTDFRGGREMEIAEIVGDLDENIPWVSLTGGEPMLEENLPHLIDRMKEKNFKIFLETNGTLFDGEVFSLCDFVSVDLKGPSSGNAGYNEDAFSYCLKNPKKTQLKVVVQTDEDLDFFRGVYDHEYENWVLQPEWEAMGGTGGLGVLDYYKIRNEFPGVRVIAQMHKLMGLR